ncbi:MAG: exonuclease SbcCD subunit D C-terminal domain-containing protein [Acidobacteriota bacterium]
MRLLHSADWHLGARLHEQRRSEDEKHALAQLVQLTELHAVDAVIIAGDVFDTANPGAEDMQRYYRTLGALRDAGVGTVVVIAGNHDSAARLEAPRTLLEVFDIHVVGRLEREAPAENAVVELRGRSGSTVGVCAAVPYLRDGDLRLATAGERTDHRAALYARALGARYAEVVAAARAHSARRESPLPLVVTGHCYAAGAQVGGLERPVQLGGEALVAAGDLAGDADYLALGHLHRPQAVAGREAWRYAGSLLPTGFDEAGQTREVVLVDFETGGGPVQIERLPLVPYREYRRLAGAVDTVRSAVEALDPPADGAPSPWCEVTVRLDGPHPGLARELVELAAARGWALVSVRRERRDVGGGDDVLATEDLTQLDPEDVFRRLHADEYGGEQPDDDLLIEFRRLLEIVTGGRDPGELPDVPAAP